MAHLHRGIDRDLARDVPAVGLDLTEDQAMEFGWIDEVEHGVVWGRIVRDGAEVEFHTRTIAIPASWDGSPIEWHWDIGPIIAAQQTPGA